MNPTPSAADWAADRGETWAVHLDAMEAMLAPIAGPLLEAARLDGASRVADLGCGGGGMTRTIAGRLAAGGVAHGYDISATLVEAARARASGAAPAVAYRVADLGTAMPVDGRYDRLVSRLGVMFFDDPPAALANLVHWLTPGGRFAFAVWGPPAENRLMSGFREVVSRFVETPTPDPDAPSPFRYADADAFVRLLGNAGFRDVASETVVLPIEIGGGLPPDAAAEFAMEAFGGGGPVEEVDEVTRGALRTALIDFFAPHETAGRVRMGGTLHLVTGGVG